jgi:hypothetical protein
MQWKYCIYCNILYAKQIARKLLLRKDNACKCYRGELLETIDEGAAAV